MTQRLWVIVGATSIIAEKFAHVAAQEGHHIRLVGRQKEQLDIIANDIRLRYQVVCDVMLIDLANDPDQLLAVFKTEEYELDLLIAHSDFTDNAHLNAETISHLIKVNILASTLLIHTYLNRQQSSYNLLYLSSVAACRGRAKNSLYGASKASIEVYLQGLQQTATTNQHITIARLGFIDTKQTYGLPGIFYAAPASTCAKACWNAINHKKRLFYYPFFWRMIMAIISTLPFFLYRKMGNK
jgi:short-subunit dehydrogenase